MIFKKKEKKKIFLVQNNLRYVPFQSLGVFLIVPWTPPPPPPAIPM